MIVDTFDRDGTAEFPFPKSVVFRALCDAVAQNAMMTVEAIDKTAARIDVKAGISALSYGERVSISVTANGPVQRSFWRLWVPRRTSARQRAMGKISRTCARY